MSHRLARFLAITSAVVAASAVCASGASAIPGGKKYVAFGDSYAAGPGLAGYSASADTSGCSRSTVNYPSRVAVALGFTTSWVDYTCTGARTGWDNASHGYGGLRDQIVNWANNVNQKSLGDDTKLVTISIGGNDTWAGKRSLADTLARCASGSAWGTDGTNCATGANAPITVPAGQVALPTSAAVDASAFYTALEPSIQAIRSTAPTAMIQIVSYPAVVPSTTNASCNGSVLWYFDAPELSYIRGIQANYKAAQQGAVTAAAAVDPKIRFVDTSATGRDICQAGSVTVNGQSVPNPNKWVDQPIANWNPPSFLPGSLHPTAQGMQAFADLAVARYNAG